MKILHVITSMRIGGAEKLVSEIVPKLQAMEHQVDVLLFDGTDTAFKEVLKENKIRIIEFSNGGFIYNPLYIFRLVPLLGKYDIIHTHNTACQLFVAIASVLCSVMLIMTEHNTSNRRRGWKWYKFIDRWMYGRYKSVICISDAAERNLKEYLGDCRTSVCTIYNGVDIYRFTHALPSQSLKERALGKKIAVMVAGFRYQKDQDTLIRAMKYLPEGKYELWLVGDGERRLFLEQLCRTEQVAESVRFLGIRNDIPEILKTADFVIMSSHFEGLSLSSIEGLSSGKPFIASDVDGLHEIIEGAGILFPHEDAKALAKIIVRLSIDENYYKEIVSHCLQRAKEYDIQKTVEKYAHVYSSILE